MITARVDILGAEPEFKVLMLDGVDDALAEIDGARQQILADLDGLRAGQCRLIGMLQVASQDPAATQKANRETA
jgi:hypothetical protein